MSCKVNSGAKRSKVALSERRPEKNLLCVPREALFESSDKRELPVYYNNSTNSLS